MEWNDFVGSISLVFWFACLFLIWFFFFISISLLDEVSMATHTCVYLAKDVNDELSSGIHGIAVSWNKNERMRGVDAGYERKYPVSGMVGWRREGGGGSGRGELLAWLGRKLKYNWGQKLFENTTYSKSFSLNSKKNNVVVYLPSGQYIYILYISISILYHNIQCNRMSDYVVVIFFLAVIKFKIFHFIFWFFPISYVVRRKQSIFLLVVS